MRSKNMQRLTDQLKVRYPGVVIYGIGDEAHKKSASGHNEDDTPGSKPEQEDPDNKPEHRAIDVMIGISFAARSAAALVVVLTTVPANQRRLLYVIFDGWIYRARNGWIREPYSGSDKHRDHPHVSGTWQDDENTSDWVLDLPIAKPPTPQQEEDEPMNNVVYVRRNAPAGQKQLWALAGTAVKSGWLETDNELTANGWAGQFMKNGNSVDVDYTKWEATAAAHRGGTPA